MNSIGSKGSGLAREEWLVCSSMCVEWSYAIAGDILSREGYPYGEVTRGSSRSWCWIYVLISGLVSLLHEKILSYEVNAYFLILQFGYISNVPNTEP